VIGDNNGSYVSTPTFEFSSHIMNLV